MGTQEAGAFPQQPLNSNQPVSSQQPGVPTRFQTVTDAAEAPLCLRQQGSPPASGTLTLMWPPSYSYGYRQSMITNSLMRLANLPFKTDAICGEKGQEDQCWLLERTRFIVHMRQVPKA